MTDGPARVYVRRRGRMTTAQARALDTLAARYVVDADALEDPATLFGREAPLMVEIGFGMGQALLATAACRPDWNCLGIDVYRPGIGALLNGCEREGLTNVRVAEGDARALVGRLPEASVRESHIFFPDPWPKKRHHKRRLFNGEFAAALASRLAPGGRLLVATDWGPYADAILEVLEATPALINRHGPGAYAPRAPERPETRFEARGRTLGHDVWDLDFERER